MRRKTHEEFIGEIYSLVEYEYTILGQYVNANTSVEIRHESCGHTYSVKPYNFFSGKRCPQCANYRNAQKKRKTHNQFVEEVESLVGDEYIVIGGYTDSQAKIKMKHNVEDCGKIYEVTPSYFINGRRCSHCMYRTNEKFIKEVKSLVGEEYKFLEEYNGSQNKLSVIHNVCGTIYKTTPANFITTGNRCPVCNVNRQKKSKDDFLKEIEEMTNGEYYLLGEYITSYTKTTIVHNICGHKYEVSPNNFLRGRRCPKCSESTGEKRISLYLKNNNFNHKGQYKLANCKNVKQLPFDFAVLDDNYKLICLIEYQGKQHYESVDFFGGEKRLKYITTNDTIKQDYCKQNNIPLLRIPYWEHDNIEKLIESFIKELKLGSIQLELVYK